MGGVVPAEIHEKREVNYESNNLCEAGSTRMAGVSFLGEPRDV
jgi:hypothetical protein